MDKSPAELSLNSRQSQLEALYKLLYPEILESSKVLSILAETNNFSFRITDLLSIKEVAKFTAEKEHLLSLLSSIECVKLSENKETANIVIPDNISVFSLLNVPQKMAEEELLKIISVPKEKFLRIYKKSLFWIIVTDQDVPSTVEIENKLKNVEFSDGAKLRYDYLTRSGLIKGINKQIQTSNYHKEAHELKAAGGRDSNGNIGKINVNANSNNKDRTNSEALSWRKKSIEQNGANVNNNLNSPKMSIDGGKLRGSSQWSNTATPGNYNSNQNNRKDSNYRRERFNSEGNTNKYANNSNFNKYEEIEIDVTNLKYSLSVKYKYTLQEMINYYETLKSKSIFQTRPKFNMEVPDLISETSKQISSQVIQKGRERSNTTLGSFSNSSNKAMGGLNTNSDKKNSFSSYHTHSSVNAFYYANTTPTHEDFKAPRDSGMKIPMNNPLGSLGKGVNNMNNMNGMNKFDDPNLVISPMTLTFNSMAINGQK